MGSTGLLSYTANNLNIVGPITIDRFLEPLN